MTSSIEWSYLLPLSEQLSAVARAPFFAAIQKNNCHHHITQATIFRSGFPGANADKAK
jgi:hypothetical protein